VCEAWSISPGFGEKLTLIGHQLQRMLQHRNIGAGFMRIFAQVATPLAGAIPETGIWRVIWPR
jgi:hypothetical protein